MSKYSNVDNILAIFKLAKMDPKYAEMDEEYGIMEDRFDKLVAKLSDEEQDVI